MNEPIDIIILGAGLVGSSLACALESSGHRVALVEAAAPAAGSPSFDERKLGLSAASLNALDALKVLSKLATAPSPIRRLHVSRAGDFGVVRLEASDYGRDKFGAVVLARELGQALDARLSELPRLLRYCPATVVAIESGSDERRVRIERNGSPETIAAKLVVAADGTRSFARAALGIGTVEHDYSQTLLVCSLIADRPSDGTAYERFTEHGPVALLPMGEAFGAVCGVSREDAERVLALDDAGYAEYLQRRFGWRAGRFLRVGKRSAYPIVRVLAERLTAPRAVLAGNAAQTLHPIGAQGFNLGLRDALSLAELCSEGADPGSAELLRAYEQARREDRERTLAFSDGLARATANETFSMHVLRSLGLLMLGQAPGLAAPLLSGAMGFRGQVPALARSQA